MTNYKQDTLGRDIIPWDDLQLAGASHTGDSAILCPACSHDRKKANIKCFSVNVSKGVGSCKHCGGFSVNSDNQIKIDRPVSRKEYVRPQPLAKKALPDQVVEYFKNRGISEKTLTEGKVGYTREYFPQQGKEMGAIVFPYYMGGELANMKYRSRDKDFKLSKGAELIMQGLDDIDPSKPVAIVEGEPDRLSLMEAGFKNVLSVPNGCSGITQKEKDEFAKTGVIDSDRPVNLDYLDNSYEYIKDVENWIIWTDTDLPGLKLRNELVRRFGSDNCKLIDSGAFKDANEVLVAKGVDEVVKLLHGAKECEIDGVVDDSSRMDYIDNLKDYGVERGLELPVAGFETHFRQRLGELDIITGVANHGKTWYTIWYCIMCSVHLGWKWALYLPENSPAARIDKTILEILIGDSIERMDRKYIPTAMEWITDHFVIVDYDDKAVGMNDLLATFKSIVKQRGINGVVVDPLNDLYHDFKGKSIDHYYQEMLSDIRRFKKKYNLKFILSAHPHTHATREKEDHAEQGSRPRVIEIPDITGGNIFHNRADNGISLYRNVGADQPEIYTVSEVHIQKVKFQDEVGRPTPRHSPIKLYYQGHTRRFKDKLGNDPLEGVFKDKIWEPKFVGEQSAIETKIEEDPFATFESEESPF